jgi:hypothetical protein
MTNKPRADYSIFWKQIGPRVMSNERKTTVAVY